MCWPEAAVVQIRVLFVFPTPILEFILAGQEGARAQHL